MLEAKRKLTAGDPVGARAALKQLPEEMRKTKVVMMFDINVAVTQSDEEYLAAIDRFSAQYPNDPALHLVLLDQAFLRKDYKRGLEYVGSLDKQLGGDPYLDVQRAGMLVTLGDHAMAVAAATRATERAPELTQSWWALLTAQLAAKQFGPALVTVEKLSSTFAQRIDLAAMQADERFAELLVSPEYKATLGN